MDDLYDIHVHEKAHRSILEAPPATDREYFDYLDQVAPVVRPFTYASL